MALALRLQDIYRMKTIHEKVKEKKFSFPFESVVAVRVSFLVIVVVEIFHSKYITQVMWAHKTKVRQESWHRKN